MNTQFLSTLEFALVPVPEYKVETKPYILLHRKSDMLLGTNRCEVQKALLVFNQSDKSSDSGLPAYDYTEYSCLPITRTFTRLLEPRANSNQNRFPQDFRHTLTVILPSVSRTLDNSNLPQTRSSFCFPLRSFLYIFTLDNSNHVLSPSEVEKTNSLLVSETLNFEFPIDVL